jgi:ribosomal protein L19E
MNLLKKKMLAARTLKVGKERVVFNITRLDDIKEAITKQDILDLQKDRAISIKEIKGKRKLKKRKTRRRIGSIKKKVNSRKKDYIVLTRKLRRHILALKRKGEISNKEFIELRKEIRASSFKSLAQLKQRISEVEK